MDDFIVSGSYQGYVYVGNAQGNFDTEQGKRPYFNMYVLNPVSTYSSEDYMGLGFKAEKLKCTSADVWAGLEIGEQVQLFFDNKKRVQLATSVSAAPVVKAAPEKSETGKSAK